MRALIFCLFLAPLPALACPLPPTEASEAEATLALVNQARAQHNLDALVWNGFLSQAARHHGCDLAARRQLSHQGRDGSSPAHRARQTGYQPRSIGENLGLGQKSAHDMVTGWMGSPAHRANILAPQMREAGFALTLTPEGRKVWVMLYAAP